MTTRMSASEIDAYLDEVFPQLHYGGRTYFIEAVGLMTARMRCDYHEKHLRPGGTISGPTMMALADLALYAAILAQIGPVGLAVTTSLNFNFLRKPGQTALIGEAKLLKLGKRLAVGEVCLYSQGETELVCHATGTYSIPVAR
ncbi:phenylacetic acid degradation protein [Bosea sp. Root670]|uniref:PaaI family thioesterase n=1 Tax=Bosea sp. Root670 TaxID=1736583 RepID=UPI00071344C9|nr:PaaI family thioesterase [Bosea sp. Root670]KRE08309.1 phenylacetic acid degradation protein [Bosea sp. Root670]